MSRVVLIHWQAEEAAERAAHLERAGYDVGVFSDRTGGTTALAALRGDPPDAFVVDLSRLPSHGREVAAWLRQQKPTRGVPLVFAGGNPEKVAKTREILPDATYADWRGLRGALSRALRNPPQNPVVPGAMAGYSGTPLPKKLRIREGCSVALLGAPDDFETTLGELPPGVRLKRQARGKNDVVLLFARSRADLTRRFSAAVRALGDKGGLWIAWPKKASGIPTDLTQNDVRGFGLDAGLVDYKICAIDATFSGLLFARRRTSDVTT